MDARNKAMETRELELWETKPERFTAYYRFIQNEIDTAKQARYGRQRFYPSLSGASVSTWLGTRLGTIIEARVYPHNLGGRFVSLRVRGSNGAVYYGRASWDNGEVINLRKAKGDVL